MEFLASELKEEIWKKLPFEDLLNLCETDIEFNQICQDSHTWKFLLMRDFGIKDVSLDPKIKYIQEHTRKQVRDELFNKRVYMLVDNTGWSQFTTLANDSDEFFSQLTDAYNQGKLPPKEDLVRSLTNFVVGNKIEIVTAHEILWFIGYYPFKMKIASLNSL